MLLRQSQTLIRHCCWCVRGLKDIGTGGYLQSLSAKLVDSPPLRPIVLYIIVVRTPAAMDKICINTTKATRCCVWCRPHTLPSHIDDALDNSFSYMSVVLKNVKHLMAVWLVYSMESDLRSLSQCHHHHHHHLFAQNSY